MAKGSQLSQLKAALSQAGIRNQGTKRKRSAVPTKKDKAKNAAKLDEIHRKLNPFDVKVTRLKHDVGGRKIKGVVGKPAQSRTAGIEQVWIWSSNIERRIVHVFMAEKKDIAERV